MKLTVIIPVYRVEATLDRCVESVVRQQIQEMEIILVDDGSPDKCPQMCDDWAKKDARIRVIHKENGGLSDARNAGLDVAKGDYITFVDSDDWISPDTYRPLLEQMGDSGLLEYCIEGRLLLNDHLYEEADQYWIQERAYTHTYACNKIYRKDLFEDIRFPKGRIFEDAYTFPALLRKCNKVRTSSKGIYHYTRNPQGITAKANGKALDQLLEANINNGMPIDDYYYMRLVNIQIDVWEHNRTDIILPPRKIDTSRMTGNMKLKALFLNLLGIRMLCWISRFIHLFKKPTRI